MIQNSGNADKVLWSELLPYEFKQRLSDSSLVYIPLGICEPHGQISAFGLDTIKAEWLCIKAARRAGGIVAPALGYQIHESGYHARWLEEVVGEENPHMTAMPPHVLLLFFLYQLRALANAGFRSIIAVTGHSGGNQEDLRTVAWVFMTETGVPVRVVSDPELVEDVFTGDHAGKYEISQLLYLRPELVDFSQLKRQYQEGSGGRLALGNDAHEATAELGERIMNACLDSLCRIAAQMRQQSFQAQGEQHIQPKYTYNQMDKLWQQLSKRPWITSNPHAGQRAVSEDSQWKPYEHL